MGNLEKHTLALDACTNVCIRSELEIVIAAAAGMERIGMNNAMRKKRSFCPTKKTGLRSPVKLAGLYPRREKVAWSSS